MADQFSIGEVAWHVFWKCTVTIQSPLEWTRGRKPSETTGSGTWKYSYLVARHDSEPVPFGRGWRAVPESLRKLPPPEAGMKWEDLKKSLQPKVRA